MIKRIMLIGLLVAFIGVSVQAQALQKVEHKTASTAKQTTAGIEKKALQNKQTDSTAAKTATAKTPDTTKAKTETKQRKDEFVDKDGDGINDCVAKQKSPAVKKQDTTKTTAASTNVKKQDTGKTATVSGTTKKESAKSKTANEIKKPETAKTSNAGNTKKSEPAKSTESTKKSIDSTTKIAVSDKSKDKK